MNTNFCKHLRSKKMYIPALSHEVADEKSVDGGIGPCWCNRTMAEVGPDDRQVAAKNCNSSRSCFQD